MDWGFVALNGMVCAAAILFAAHASSQERHAALILSTLILLDWIQYVSAWTDYKPALLFAGVMTSKDIWSVSDAIVGVVAARLAYRFWWGRTLWQLVLVQETLHGGYWLKLYDFDFYSHGLDAIFLLQLALFFAIGGRGVVDRLHRCTAWLLSRRPVVAPTFRRTRR